MSRRTRLPVIAAAVLCCPCPLPGGRGRHAQLSASSLGNRGSDVRAIQGFLREHGATDLRITGIFDPPTATAVRAFQTATGCP